MAEGLSINNFLSSLSKRGYQRGNKYFVTFQSIPMTFSSAIRNNGFLRRDFNREFNSRVQSVEVPSLATLTSDISDQSAFAYKHVYGFNISDSLSLRLLSDASNRFYSVFQDWLELTTGTVSAGQIPYRDTLECDLAIIGLDDQERARHGFLVRNAILSSVSNGSFADSEEGAALMSFDVVLNPRSMDRLNSVEAATIFRSNI